MIIRKQGWEMLAVLVLSLSSLDATLNQYGGGGLQDQWTLSPVA